MLNGFEESLKDLELSEEIRATLIKNANALASGLSDKNQDLITKNKSLSDLSTSGKELADSGAEKLKVLEQFKSDADVKAAEAADNYADAKAITAENHANTLKSASELSKKALEEALSKSNGFESQLKSIMVDGEIKNELIKFDVKKELMEMAHASIAQQANFTDGKAMIGDQSLSDYMKAWAESDAGKAARLAPNNSGGNAQGSSTTNTDPSGTMTDSQKRAAKINERFNKN